MTEYLVFRADFDKEAWVQIGDIHARSARSAVREVLAGIGNPTNDASSFVAVPARSWKPVTVKVETKTQLKFS